ncbi:MAG: pyridoxal phosphate enzyme (YggS family) [Halieaceae bacterium]|jgi:pyridoxal phosphate enzyme (YggS family)
MLDQTLSNKLTAVRHRIRLAAEKCQRDPKSISLLAVSKTRSASEIRAVHSLGNLCFGENYLQEAQAKQAELVDLPLHWHFIGPVQSNKTREIAASFSWLHSLDREKIANRVSQYRPKHLPSLQCCIQVNIDREASKAGVLPEEVVDFADLMRGLKGIQLRGLMAIPRPSDDYEEQLDSYSRLAQLSRNLQPRHPDLDQLSMGMSQDLEAAIAAGSTMVRVGTDIFGPRVKPN